MPNSNLKNVPLWKIAMRLGTIFILILSVIKFFWNWIETGNLNFIKKAFDSGEWIGFAFSMLIGGLIYGFSVGYFYKKQASEQNN